MISDKSFQNVTRPNSDPDREYWLSKLRDCTGIKGFPTAAPPFRQIEGKTVTASFTFPDRIFRKLLAMSSGSDYGIFLILLSGVKYLLYRYGGNEDTLVTVPVFRQKNEGVYINSILPLRSRVNGKMTFKEFLLDTKKLANEANGHRNFPVLRMPEHMKVREGNGASPLSGTAVLLENIHSRNSLAEIKAEVTFDFLRSESDLQLFLEYNGNLYGKETIDSILGNLSSYLDHATENPSVKLSEINLASDMRGPSSGEPGDEGGCRDRKLDIKPLHKGIWDCMENAMVTLLSWYGRSHELIFAETWGFGFTPGNPGSAEKLGDGIKTMKGEAALLAEKYYGLRLENFYNYESSHSLRDIGGELEQGRPVGLNVNLRWCPWSDFYKRYDSFHICIAAGMDKTGDKLYIVDPTLEKSEVYLPVDNFDKACYGYGIISVAGKEAEEVSWREILNNAVKRLRGGAGIPNAFEEMRSLSGELKRHLDLGEEIRGYEKPMHSPLISSLLYVSAGRINFANVLKYLAERFDIKELMTFSKDVEQAGWKWQAVRMLLIKACSSPEMYINMDDITREIEKIAVYEEELARVMEELGSESYITSSLKCYLEEQARKPLEEEKKLIFLDIGDYVNNKGFASIGSRVKSEGFDNNGYFYLADYLPENKILEAKGMQFLLPHAYGGMHDNIACRGQRISLPEGSYRGIMLLGSSECGNFSDRMYIRYEDGLNEEAFLQFSDWWEPEPNFGEEVICSIPCGRYMKEEIQVMENKASLFAKSYSLGHGRPLKSIQLPDWPNLHVFAISLICS